MVRLVLFLLLAIGTGAAAVDAIVLVRSDLVPPDVDVSHRWDDLAHLARRVVSYLSMGTPDLREAPPFDETRVVIAKMAALIFGSCSLAFLIGGVAALRRPMTAVLLVAMAGAIAFYISGTVMISAKSAPRQALASLAVAIFASALLGNIAARALRHLRF